MANEKPRIVKFKYLAIVIMAVAIAVGGFFTWLGTANGFSARTKLPT